MYTEMQARSGLRVGDVVKIVRKAEYQEADWSQSWVFEMDKCIGKEFTITAIKDYGIIFKETGFIFPYFVLVKKDVKPGYAERQVNSGLRVGDVVKVLRSAKNYEEGWGLTWLDSMNDFIGQTGEIESIHDTHGISIDFGYDCVYMPYFVLKLTSAVTEFKFDIGDVVKVTRIARDYENGWGAIWNPQMNAYVGNTYTIIERDSKLGYRVLPSFWFPEFVLEKPNSFRVHDPYSVVRL